MSDDELQDGMESEGMSHSWTDRYIALLAFVRTQRDAATAAAEGHADIALPIAPDNAALGDIEAAERLRAVLDGRRAT